MKLKTGLYLPGKRKEWIKVKKEYLDNLCEPVDHYVIAAFLGKGKRSGKYASYLIADKVIRNGEEVYLDICGVATGMSDKDIDYYNERILEDGVKTKPRDYIIHKNTKPDIFIERPWVFEIKFFDKNISKRSEAGYSYLFPVFVKEKTD